MDNILKKIAMICAILEEPALCQKAFNEIVSKYQHMVKGRMGIPFDDERIAAICITIIGDTDEINALTGKLGNIPNVQIKTAISKKEIQ